MSFFNSLQQYVTDSVANLSLSPKRFSFNREESLESNKPPASENLANSTNPENASTSRTRIPHGFPKVVPPPGTVTPSSQLLSTRCRTLKCSPSTENAAQSGLIFGDKPDMTKWRAGSFRKSIALSTDRPQLVFCRRRPSWPEVDVEATSGVQETDGSFFESFTALSWKQANRRLMVLQEVEIRAEKNPMPMQSSSFAQKYHLDKKELEQLYIEVLYTIANTVGASTGQYAYYKEDLFEYAQKAFCISSEQHRRLLDIASEEKQPIVVLNVIVIEADGLEAKDANGFSDPYCMLGIQPGYSGVLNNPSANSMHRLTPHLSHHEPPRSPTRQTAVRALSDGAENETFHQEKLRKHHSFRLSFKRKDTPSRQIHRESLTEAVPAKFIRATSVKPHTLSPKWQEKFRFDIDTVNTDILHLDIWDHDDETSVFDAVSKLNEVRGVKGLGRFFKQIARSARSGSQDDFLGCINIPLQDIPSTGLDCWYKLEARTHRSNIQGRIRLKLWLSTREDRGTCEEDNWGELRQQERLYTVFLDYETSRQEMTFMEELPPSASTILHQHAIQGDVTELQQALIQWVASAKHPLSEPKILHRCLQKLDSLWHTDNLSRDEEEFLAESFNGYLETTLEKISHHRTYFPPLNRPAVIKLEYHLRCLGLLASMAAFSKCCPFNKKIRGEIITALRKGSLEWYEEMRRHTMCHNLESYQDTDRDLKNFTYLVTILIVDLEQGQLYYNSIFDKTNAVLYFTVVYKQFDKLIHNELGSRVPAACRLHQDREENYSFPPGADVSISIFELYVALQEFYNLKQHLSQSDQKNLAIAQYYQWFAPAVDKWLDLAKLKAIRRIRKAGELDRICTGERIVKHCTSAVDATSCFYQIKEFWKQLAWPDLPSACVFIQKIIDAICSAANYYAELVHQKLADSGYYEEQIPYKTTDEMCVAINGLEYVRRWVVNLGDDLAIENILMSLDTNDVTRQQWRNTLLNPLEQTPSQMLLFINQIISRIGDKMRSALKKTIFHLAWSPDSLPTTEAIISLLEYLDLHLGALNKALLPENFNRILQNVWEVVLNELENQLDGNTADKPAIFYTRLHEALELLQNFFHADGKGLSYQVLKSSIYLNIEERLEYHEMDTVSLIDRFYRQRLQDQINTTSTEYGILTVRAYLNHDSLCIEVISARDVIPLDPNGFSDPFVIIELLPRRIFCHCAEQQTNVKKKTLHPVFDECFEFSVNVQQCELPDAIVLFTVMDHDVLTANDFAGEAFLGLSSIPGVADSNVGIDNFHGLKHQELPLMHQKNKNHPILQILETRIGDKQALDFVKKQKPRQELA